MLRETAATLAADRVPGADLTQEEEAEAALDLPQEIEEEKGSSLSVQEVVRDLIQDPDLLQLIKKRII